MSGCRCSWWAALGGDGFEWSPSPPAPGTKNIGRTRCGRTTSLLPSTTDTDHHREGTTDMGLARDLTMGPGGGRRHRGAGRFPLPPEFTALRALTGRVRAGTASDAETAELRDLVGTVSTLTRRLRFEEGAILNGACTAYLEATGETIGPTTGVLA